MMDKLESLSDEDEFYDCIEENVSSDMAAASLNSENNSLKDTSNNDATTSSERNSIPAADKEVLNASSLDPSVDFGSGESVENDGGEDVRQAGTKESADFAQSSTPASDSEERTSDNQEKDIVQTHSDPKNVDQAGNNTAENTQEMPGDSSSVGTNDKSEEPDSTSKFEDYDLESGVSKSSHMGQTSDEDSKAGAGDNREKEELEKDEESSEDESSLTEAEIDERTIESKKFKEEGNEAYKNGDCTEAERLYTEGLKICPKCSKKDRAVLYSNRSACRVKMDKTELAIEDCTEAVELHPAYLKAFLRRAQLYDKLEKYEEATKDYEEVLKLDPSIHSARAALLELPEKIEKRNEKMKAQMMTSLKDLGNLFLRPFGLSTDNFQLQQDPNSGSYNIQFNNGPQPQNGPNNGPTNGPSNQG